jgi:asparagine synthase (glutamine-hydrolysing)
VFQPDYVRHLLDEHCAFTRDHHTRLWALLMLELWFQMWIDSPAEPDASHPPGRSEIGVSMGSLAQL